MIRKFFIFAVAAIMAVGCNPPDHTDLYREVKSVEKMVFSSMSITKTARLDSSDWYKIGKRIAVYSYDTYMQAYIDMSALEPGDLVFDEKARRVRVVLPPVKTEIVGRDMKMRKEYDNIGLMRGRIDAKERAAMKEKANTLLKAEVEKNPVFKARLIEEAQRKARTYFEALFEENGYQAEIEFK